MSIEHIKKELERLYLAGMHLYLRLAYEETPEQFKNQKELHDTVKNLPLFASSYQSWYTEALEFLRQAFPSRVDDFVSYLNPAKSRKSIDYSNYTISDALRGTSIKGAGLGPSAAIRLMLQQAEIIKSARNSIDSVLVKLRAELQANLFDDDLDAARELNSKSFPRAAGMMAGVVIEGHLKEVANRHQVKIISKSPTIAIVNDALKGANIYDVVVWRRVQAVGDVRNQCGHKGSSEPSKEDVARMIDDVADLIKRIS